MTFAQLGGHGNTEIFAEFWLGVPSLPAELFPPRREQQVTDINANNGGL